MHNIQQTIDHPKGKICMKDTGDCPKLSPPRLDGSQGVRQGCRTAVRPDRKTLKTKLAQGGLSGSSPLRSDDSCVGQVRG